MITAMMQIEIQTENSDSLNKLAMGMGVTTSATTQNSTVRRLGKTAPCQAEYAAAGNKKAMKKMAGTKGAREATLVRSANTAELQPMSCEIFICGLTPELSRPAKRVWLE